MNIQPVSVTYGYDDFVQPTEQGSQFIYNRKEVSANLLLSAPEGVYLVRDFNNYRLKGKESSGVEMEPFVVSMLCPYDFSLSTLKSGSDQALYSVEFTGTVSPHATGIDVSGVLPLDVATGRELIGLYSLPVSKGSTISVEGISITVDGIEYDSFKWHEIGIMSIFRPRLPMHVRLKIEGTYQRVLSGMEFFDKEGNEIKGNMRFMISSMSPSNRQLAGYADCFFQEKYDELNLSLILNRGIKQVSVPVRVKLGVSPQIKQKQ